ncbi:MAG TPA: DUF4160 domain-containing protein [Longimicrobiaceae bacterium]|nr:DUF4160 domain-containing protein [Longimicrobiaceae bacterium]
MPTIYRVHGFAFRIYTHDHEPPHVHAVKDGAVAKITLGDEDEAAEIVEVGDMRDRDVIRALRIVDSNWREFLERWREIHG